MTWAYNAKTYRWEALTPTWRAMAWRAPNRHDWETAIEAIGGDVRHVSPVVFQSSDAARAWCEQAMARERLELDTDQ